MSRRITITLGICIAGSVFTVGMLFLPADDAPTAPMPTVSPSRLLWRFPTPT